MALSRSMKNLMHDRAQASKPMRTGVSRSMPPQQPGAISRTRAPQQAKPVRAGVSRSMPPVASAPSVARGAPGLPAKPQRGMPRRDMPPQQTPVSQGRPSTGTFGFASKQGVRGGFQVPPARTQGDRIRGQVAGTTGPVPGRRGGGIPRAFGSRQYLR